MTTTADRLFQQCDPEIWIITARSQQRKSGLVATYVTQASITENPRIMVGLAHHHFTQRLIAESGAFCAHLMTEEQIEWVWRFGTCSGRNVEKFDGVEELPTLGPAPILAGSPGWLECRVEATLDTGDRMWYLADVVKSCCESDFRPLTIGRVLALVDDAKREKLDLQLSEDAVVDQQAIVQWRDRR